MGFLCYSKFNLINTASCGQVRRGGGGGVVKGYQGKLFWKNEYL